ncbi:MAG: SMP-30/gluconolactonase/LRE family protein [Hyphomonadaceae bacterium]
MEIVAEGLLFPEAPVAMPDGSVILAEIRRGTLSRVWNGKIEVIAELGGGPNGAALGPDGAMYVCNNGGARWHNVGGLFVPGHAPKDYETGRIERVDLSTGKFERIYESVNGNRLSGPNDIVFDAEGGFWFTDLGKSFARHRDNAGLYYAKPDGSMIREAAYPCVSLNGVGLSPDGKTLYAADTISAKLWASDVTAPGVVPKQVMGALGRCAHTQPAHVFFDSLAVEAGGKVCVATIVNGGITTIDPQSGAWEHTPFPDQYTTNICFGGDDMMDAYVTLSSTGVLAKVRWPRPGLKLNFLNT